MKLCGIFGGAIFDREKYKTLLGIKETLEIYFDDLAPNENEHNLVMQLVEIEKNWNTTEFSEVLEKYSDINDEYNSITAEKYFIAGYIVAMRTLRECLM